MLLKRIYICLILVILWGGMAYSQVDSCKSCIDFRVGKSMIDPNYSDNSNKLNKIRDFLRVVMQDSTIEVIEVSFRGAASPEGSAQVNRKLARKRLSAVETLVRKEIRIPESIITRDDGYIPWDYLASEISKSDIPCKDSALSIIREEEKMVGYHNGNIDNRVVKLQKLNGGKTWREIFNRYFKQMRTSCVAVITQKQQVPVVKLEPGPALDLRTEVVGIFPQQYIKTTLPSIWTRHLHLKTNAVGWAMAIANLAVEIDLAPHWSFTIPVYYSAWDYFKSTIKMRTFAIQPEFRYWFSKDNEGFFGGAHFGMAYYNFAFDGAYRYQDHFRRTPSLGGGIGIGYRMPLDSKKRWHFETSLGAGVYTLHYDKFHNTPRTKDGLLVGSVKKTFFGIDQVSVSFTYMFDLDSKISR